MLNILIASAIGFFVGRCVTAYRMNKDFTAYRKTAEGIIHKLQQLAS